MNAFRRHLLQTPVENFLFQLEVRNAVAEKAADAVRFFKYGNCVAGAIQLLGSRKSGWPRAHDGDSFARARFGELGLDPTFLPRPVDNRFFDQFNCDGRLVDPQDASRLAGRGTNAAGKLRKIICGVQHTNRFFPMIAINEVIPIRNDVGYGASGVAERNAAIHAARGLYAHLLFRKRLVNLEIIVDAFLDRPARRHLARIFLKSCDLTH